NALARHLLAEIAPAEGPVSAPLDHLDALSAAVLAAPPDDATRARLAERLRELLGRLDGSSGTGAVAERIESATDEEIFDFIDKELGIGG
ncbi:MAG TPA: hypothetical protein VLW53_19890, partial [Candidatus Eisenbacteria bacterium]|nr:hypothetical protein [Candidatus Eisenbacteria bacterium]